jgi:hypothetical protein
MWKKASLPCLSRRIQQKVHCKRRIQRRVNLRCRSVSSEDSCSLKRAEPSGSKTTARPNRVRAKSTQLKSTSPKTIGQTGAHRMLENICLEESKENRIILLRCILRGGFARPPRATKRRQGGEKWLFWIKKTDLHSSNFKLLSRLHRNSTNNCLSLKFAMFYEGSL